MRYLYAVLGFFIGVALYREALYLAAFIGEAS